MKLRRKLLSAGLALGATALTLTTSTFAWYTANTEVTMDGVTGASAATEGSTLLISSVSTQGTFGSSVTLTTSTSALYPVQYTAGATGAPTFAKIGSSGAMDGGEVTTGAAAHDVMQFDLFFKANSATNVNLKRLEFEHVTSTLPAKDLLTTVGTSITNGASTSTYTVDMFRALKIAWYSETYIDAAKTATSSCVARQIDELVNFKSDSITSAWNAHEYYNEVSGNEIATTGAASVTTSFTVNALCPIGTTPNGVKSGTYLVIHFYVFLDGWDLQCFDACQNQDFTLDMEFTSSTEDTAKLTKTVSSGAGA